MVVKSSLRLANCQTKGAYKRIGSNSGRWEQLASDSLLIAVRAIGEISWDREDQVLVPFVCPFLLDRADQDIRKCDVVPHT